MKTLRFKKKLFFVLFFFFLFFDDWIRTESERGKEKTQMDKNALKCKNIEMKNTNNTRPVQEIQISFRVVFVFSFFPFSPFPKPKKYNNSVNRDPIACSKYTYKHVQYL